MGFDLSKCCTYGTALSSESGPSIRVLNEQRIRVHIHVTGAIREQICSSSIGPLLIFEFRNPYNLSEDDNYQYFR